MLFQGKYQYLDDWVKFCESEEAGLKAVQKDSWNMFYDFYMITKGGIESFVDDGTWPVLIDQFMEFYQSKHS